MEQVKETCGRTIDVVKQQIIFNGKVTQVRPKTFQLLLQFIKNPQKLITKKQLLANVWDDVEVSEQVLFQTIRELRGLFDGEDVISTQPRKGYVWTCSVQSPAIKVSSTGVFTKSAVGLFLALLICVSSVAIFLSTAKSPQQTLSGSLVVLPVKSEIADNAHNWVYLGGMDQLISYFTSDENLAVLKPEHVLEVMKEAEISVTYTANQLTRIFDVSGASLIVESTLSGAISDYQLQYTLYFKNYAKRGVIFDKSVTGAIEKLALVISEQTQKKLEERPNLHESDFNNEMLVRAIEKRKAHDYAASNRLLEGLLVDDQNNIVAHRIMAANLIALNELDSAKRVLATALEIANLRNQQELQSLYYYQAVIDSISNKPHDSLTKLTLTTEVAKNNNDWLYQAYASELKGKIYMKLGKLLLAEQAFKEAMNHYSVIQCPVGKSQSLMSLSRVAKLAGNDSLAMTSFHQASEIIAAKGLVSLNKDLDFVRGKLF